MSEYPRAFGLFPIFGDFEYVDFTQSIEGAEITATEYGKNRIKVIELIPLPEHEALVAAERKAERERMTSIIRSINPCDIEDSRPTFAGATLRYVLDKIREVPS